MQGKRFDHCHMLRTPLFTSSSVTKRAGLITQKQCDLESSNFTRTSYIFTDLLEAHTWSSQVLEFLVLYCSFKQY